jgi:hypothetical protein
MPTVRARPPRATRRQRGSRGDPRKRQLEARPPARARGKQWPIPFLALIGLIAVIGSLLLYKADFVDKGSVGLVVLDLLLFFGGGFS